MTPRERLRDMTPRTKGTIVCISCIRCSLKDQGHTLDIAPLSEGTSLQKRSGMARVVKGFHSFTLQPRVYPQMAWGMPAFAFPIEAGSHLPTPDG